MQMRLKAVRSLADQLESSSFIERFVEAYILDTAYVRKDVLSREIKATAALLRMRRSDVQASAERIPMGKVVVFMPKNSLGFTLAKAVVSSYLMGNQTIVYFPAQLKRSAAIYGDLIKSNLKGVEIAPFGGSSSKFLRQCLRDPEISTIVIYGDDSWIDAYRDSCAENHKKLIFEGPGNDPLIVMADADLDAAVDGAVRCGLNNGGQSCSALERFFVDERVLEEFSQLLIARLKKLKLGSPYLEETDIGPIDSKIVLARMQRQIEESTRLGAKLLYGGEAQIEPVTGLPMMVPAVLSQCTVDMPVVAEENFGPVFPLLSFSSIDQLLADLDKTHYGLNASVYGTVPVALASYLQGTHRNWYVNSTSVCPMNVSTRLLDGGFKRSGFVWDFTAEPRIVVGRRSLMMELSQNPASDQTRKSG